MSNASQSPLSGHALMRCQQRGIPRVLIEQLIVNHDIDHEIGDDCRALRMSRRALDSKSEVRRAAQHLELLGNLTVIWSDRKNQVVTAFRDKGGSKTRRYRGRG